MKFKQPKCPLVNEWTNKMGSIQAIDCAVLNRVTVLIKGLGGGSGFKVPVVQSRGL